MNEFIVTLDDSQFDLIATKKEIEELRALILSIKDQNTITATYKTEEAAEMLGCSIPILREYRKQGKIKASKIGASYIYTSKEINKAIENGIKYNRNYTY